ncbi:outer dynein arm-docking complex subunit 4 isoform X1 [Tribolium castaneum]|nr:PREDICTED: tetratricopeptide repeat protein 25 isoform X1 [Tribolium castaneum]|eukprot:XP_008193619.1 PREDICTED: tetratricopeptide repeat protein 25 isoform X1 [Tribolium castaneum]
MSEELTPIALHKRLSISREAELLQSFVGVHVDDDDSVSKSEEVKIEEPKSEKEIKDGDDGKKKTDESIPPPQELMSEEIKKKGKRRRRRNGTRREELYCDKDRAAAVNMGSKDIKQSLKLKRKQDRSKALQIPEEAEPGTFLALGNYEMCRGDLQIAINFMSKALELNPTEKSALVARSKCYILLGQPENALTDAETALSIDKTYLRAIYQKAEALYYLGDFEHSLMYYHRGLHIRPDHEDFKLGVHKAQKAIENAIGSPNVFANLLTPKPASSRSEKTKTSTPESTESGKSGQRTTPGSRAKSGRKSRLLRELGPDKEYLDNLMKNPNLKCKFKEDDSSIIKTIEETVEYLNARQEFWRQQLPAHLK